MIVLPSDCDMIGDEVVIALDPSDVARIFQALAHEARRLAALDPLWCSRYVVEHAEELRDQFAAIHPRPKDCVT